MTLLYYLKLGLNATKIESNFVGALIILVLKRSLMDKPLQYLTISFIVKFTYITKFNKLTSL